MSTLPRVRWLALLLAVNFLVILFGVGFDLASALGTLGLKAATVASALLAGAKLIVEVMGLIDEEDPTPDPDGYVHTMDRDAPCPGLWERVL